MNFSSLLQLALLCVAACLSTVAGFTEQSGVSPIFHVLSIRAEIYILPALAYEYDQLEPYITRDMMIAHYEGHHDGYRRKMNAVLNEWREDVS